MEEAKAKTENLIDQLTVSDDFNIGLTGDQIYSDTHISPVKPTQTEWFRVYGNSLNDIKKGVLCKVKVGFKDEDFIIGGDAQFKARVQHDMKKVRKVYLAYYETSNGRMGIWPITVAAGRMMSNKWIDTATQIVEEAQKKWVKFVSNQTNSCYDCFRAREVDQEQYGEPKFKLPYNEIIVKAFGKDFTLTPDTYEENEYVQQSIGEQIGLKVNKDE
ncbi:hypothetical protein N9V79_01250 [Candidatus Pelagibacter bacterium]|jgi:hypothetical protein|nr:hypothetical protein [Candidatus Pelagibacter bacterium]|tara:strand:- start:2817 stop:3464 length:648 start_codon:yes stop_codon:yes gene_type:complete